MLVPRVIDTFHFYLLPLLLNDCDQTNPVDTPYCTHLAFQHLSSEAGASPFCNMCSSQSGSSFSLSYILWSSPYICPMDIVHVQMQILLYFRCSTSISCCCSHCLSPPPMIFISCWASKRSQNLEMVIVLDLKHFFIHRLLSL